MTTDAPRPKATRKQLKDHLQYMDQLRHYELSDGSTVMLSAELSQGDLVVFRGPPAKPGPFSRPQAPVYAGQVMQSDTRLETQIVHGALETVSAILRDPRCRGVGVAPDNSLIVALDLSLYAAFKETCGQGLPGLPLRAGEHFKHEAFTFVVAGASDHERGIGRA